MDLRQPDGTTYPRSLEPRHFRRLLRRAVLPPLVLLTVLAGVLLWQVNNLLTAHRLVEHSNRVIELVHHFQDQLLVTQGALRGYAVTGSAEMLDAYDRGRQSVEPSVKKLAAAISDNALQKRRVDELRPIIERWDKVSFSARERAVAAASSGQVVAPADLFAGAGKQSMDDLQAALNGITAAETTLRDARSLAVRRSAAVTVVGGVALAVILGLVFAAMARRQMVAVADTYSQALEFARGRTLAVQRSETLLRLVADSLPSLVAFIDANERYLFTNRAYEQYRGLRTEQVQGRHVREVLGPETHDRIKPHIESVLRGRHVAFDAVVNFLRTGPREVHVEYMPHTDANGKVAGFVTVIADVTEQVKAQRDLANSEDRYRTFITHSSEGIWRLELAEPIPVSASVEQQIEMMYKHAHLAECNDAMAQMYGLDRAEQIIGARLGDLLIREDPTNVAYLKAFVHSGYRLADGESVERDTHGNVRHFMNNLVGFVEDGKLVRAWGTQRDITDRKRAEEERDALLERERAARTEAERAGRVKDEFLSTLSHELRTPLNAILGWAQLLRRSDEIDDAEMRLGLETIERNSRTQAQLIDDLLDMSRIIAGKVRLDVQRVEVLGVIDSAIGTVAHAADSKGVKLYKHANALAEVSVLGDPNRLQQMVWNLLSNAIKFTPQGGRVDVTLGRFGEQVEITVVDSGVGIEPAFLPFVFDRFRQADSSTTRQHGGLGLGLSIVRQMVEMHGGTVHAHSDGPGHGATFRILLPVAAKDPSAVEAPASDITTTSKATALTAPASVPDTDTDAKEKATTDSGLTDPPRRIPQEPAVLEIDPTALSGVRVLVVDDEPDALDLLRRQLQSCDAEVFTAGSADAAIPIMAECRPHVLVSDIAMPTRDGLWLMQQIRQAEKVLGVDRTPAIALSAFARPEDRRRAMEAGFERHLAKPAEAAELVMVIAALAGPKLSGSR